MKGVKTGRIVVENIDVEVLRKRIRNLHLRVLPPDGRVRVSGPMRMSDRAIRALIVEKLSWIRRHQSRIRKLPAPLEVVTGELHPFLGDPHELHLRKGNARVERPSPGTLLLYARPGSSVKKRRAILDEWYRSELKALVPPLLEKWEAIIRVRTAEWNVRKMKTRWGSCNTKTRRIRLNLELAKQPPRSIEYVLVHELVHLLERRHGKRFQNLMDRFLPAWRERRAGLEGSSGHA